MFLPRLVDAAGEKITGESPFTLSQLRGDLAAIRVAQWAKGIADACSPESLKRQERGLEGMDTAKRAAHHEGNANRARRGLDRIAELYEDAEMRLELFGAKGESHNQIL